MKKRLCSLLLILSMIAVALPVMTVTGTAAESMGLTYSTDFSSLDAYWDSNVATTGYTQAAVKDGALHITKGTAIHFDAEAYTGVAYSSENKYICSYDIRVAFDAEETVVNNYRRIFAAMLGHGDSNIVEVLSTEQGVWKFCMRNNYKYHQPTDQSSAVTFRVTMVLLDGVCASTLFDENGAVLATGTREDSRYANDQGTGDVFFYNYGKTMTEQEAVIIDNLTYSVEPAGEKTVTQSRYTTSFDALDDNWDYSMRTSSSGRAHATVSEGALKITKTSGIHFAGDAYTGMLYSAENKYVFSYDISVDAVDASKTGRIFAAVCGWDFNIIEIHSSGNGAWYFRVRGTNQNYTPADSSGTFRVTTVLEGGVCTSTICDMEGNLLITGTRTAAYDRGDIYFFDYDSSMTDSECISIDNFSYTVETPLYQTAESIVSFDGFQSRLNGDVAGLRSRYTVNVDAALNGYTLVEVGAIMALADRFDLKDMTVDSAKNDNVKGIAGVAVYAHGAFCDADKIFEDEFGKHFAFTTTYEGAATKEKYETNLRYRAYVILEKGDVTYFCYIDAVGERFPDSSASMLSVAQAFKADYPIYSENKLINDIIDVCNAAE